MTTIHSFSDFSPVGACELYERGHANISTTSRYLGSTPQTRERAMQRFEKFQSTASAPTQTVEKAAEQAEPSKSMAS